MLQRGGRCQRSRRRLLGLRGRMLLRIVGFVGCRLLLCRFLYVTGQYMLCCCCAILVNAAGYYIPTTRVSLGNSS